jgi:hypothetical protein
MPNQEHGIPEEQPFIIVPVDPALAEVTEQMGSKDKFWYEDPSLGKTLFKAARPNTGEDWAEKAAQELCHLLGLPHVRYELADAQGVLGVVTPSFVGPHETLVHGNELLAGVSAKYAIDAEESGGRSSQYTVGLVLATLDASGAIPRPEWQLPNDVSSAVDVFVGYLLLDAWIGNTDRHQQNWGIVERQLRAEVERFLAPQFDSASSLGRNESDARRMARLESKDHQNTVEAYAERARSPLYTSEDATKPLSTLGAFVESARLQPKAANAWLARLASVDPEKVRSILQRIPENRISSTARAFALRMLAYNHVRLLQKLGTFA